MPSERVPWGRRMFGAPRPRSPAHMLPPSYVENLSSAREFLHKKLTCSGVHIYQPCSRVCGDRGK